MQNTLQNFKHKLHGANPTVLWSGGGYHFLQPLDAEPIDYKPHQLITHHI